MEKIVYFKKFQELLLCCELEDMKTEQGYILFIYLHKTKEERLLKNPIITLNYCDVKGLDLSTITSLLLGQSFLTELNQELKDFKNYEYFTETFKDVKFVAEKALVDDKLIRVILYQIVAEIPYQSLDKGTIFKADADYYTFDIEDEITLYKGYDYIEITNDSYNGIINEFGEVIEYVILTEEQFNTHLENYNNIINDSVNKFKEFDDSIK